MTTCLINVEGVLGEHSVIHGFHPIPDGVKLAHALRTGYRLVMSTTQTDERSVEHWLHINGLVRPGFYIGLFFRKAEWTDMSDSELRAEHAAALRREGDDLGLVVSSDPEAVLRVTERGIPALLFTNPTYRWAEYRPDKKRLPRPWQEIDNEVVRQMELKASDIRLSDEQEVEKI